MLKTESQIHSQPVINIALDIVIVTSIILFITGIAPGFFIALLCIVLAGAIIATIWECYKIYKT